MCFRNLIESFRNIILLLCIYILPLSSMCITSHNTFLEAKLCGPVLAPFKSSHRRNPRTCEMWIVPEFSLSSVQSTFTRLWRATIIKESLLRSIIFWRYLNYCEKEAFRTRQVVPLVENKLFSQIDESCIALVWTERCCIFMVWCSGMLQEPSC